jgi:putative N6-adenine-specific DNA methylase
MEAVNSIHLKHTRRIKIFNGNLECRFLKYEMYDGSKKLSKQKATE